MINIAHITNSRTAGIVVLMQLLSWKYSFVPKHTAINYFVLKSFRWACTSGPQPGIAICTVRIHMTLLCLIQLLCLSVDRCKSSTWYWNTEIAIASAGENPSTWMLEISGGAAIAGRSKAPNGIDFAIRYQVRAYRHDSEKIWQGTGRGAGLTQPNAFLQTAGYRTGQNDFLVTSATVTGLFSTTN